MIHPHSELRFFSPEVGWGVYATRFIPKGTITWVGVADGVKLIGWVDHAKVGEHLAKSDVFAFPSVREFGGAVALEAMAVGAIPIVLDYGGTDVHILDNGTQLYTANSPTDQPTGTVFGSYSQNLSLAAGEVIDFAVGVGPDGSFISDGTGINATLTTGAAVPEPSTLLLLAASLPGLGFIRRRTR